MKLTGDGTNIGKHVVNFAFTILEGDKAHSVAGNHCIAIFKELESYDSIKLCLEDIVEDVKGLNRIHVLGYDLNVEFYLGGDWTFLAMVTGIDSATSTHACIWCKCASLECYNCCQTWSISDSVQGARTIEENLTIGRSRLKKYMLYLYKVYINYADYSCYHHYVQNKIQYTMTVLYMMEQSQMFHFLSPKSHTPVWVWT